MALGGEIVDLVGLDFLHDVRENAGVGQIAVVQEEVAAGDMRILIKMIDAIRIEQRRAALDAVHFVAFFQQELREVGSILSGDAGDEGFLQVNLLL